MDSQTLQTTVENGQMGKVELSNPLSNRLAVDDPTSSRSPLIERRPTRYPVDLSSNSSCLRSTKNARNDEFPSSNPSSPMVFRKYCDSKGLPSAHSSPIVSWKTEQITPTSELTTVWAPPTHILAELTSLDELSFPTNSSRRIKYTCVNVSPRYLVLGTSTGTVYVFSRFASRHRAKLASLPVNMFTTKDGPVVTLMIARSECHVAVGSESGRVSVATLHITSQTSMSATPMLVHSVPGDARHPDRVSALVWSSDSNTLFAGHQSGRVNAHRINSRSVFRSSCEQLCHLDGDIVQIDYNAAGLVLLVSTLTGSYVVETERKSTVQIGTKSRSEPMGACFIKSSDDPFIIAARPNGRLWEANKAGTVYRTHQLRQSESFPIVPLVSFRDPFSTIPHMDPRIVKSEIGFYKLQRITVDGHTMIISVYEAQKIVLVDLENSPSRVVLASNLGCGICDFSVCGSDVFVLYSGQGELKKFTVFTVEKAVEKLIFKNSYPQAAHLCIYMSQWMECREKVKRDVIEKVMEGLGQISRTKETEWLRVRLWEIYKGGSEATSEESPRSISNVNIQSEGLAQPRFSHTRPPQSPRILYRKTKSQKLATGIHRVVAESMDNSGYEDDFVFHLSSPHRERSRSCFEKRLSASSSHALPAKRQSLPLTNEEIEELEREQTTREGTPDNPFERARRLLEHSTSLPEGGALRTILGLDDESSLRVEFTPTVTWANAPRTLAELARVVPVGITDEIKIERRAVQRTVTSSGARKGAKVVKAIRPIKKSIGRAPLANRMVEVQASPVSSDSKSRKSSTKSASSSSMHLSPLAGRDKGEQENVMERRDEETLECLQQRMTGLLNNEKAGSPTLAAITDSVANVEENESRHCCEICGVHRSWLVLALFAPVVKAKIPQGLFDHGGVPSSWLEWYHLMISHLSSETNNKVGDKSKNEVEACQKCKEILERVMKVPNSAHNRIRHSPSKIVINKEKVRQKVINLSYENLNEILFGEKKMNENENKGAIAPTAIVSPNTHMTSKPLPDELEWLLKIDSEVLITLCVLSLGVETFMEQLNAGSSAPLRASMWEKHWTLLTYLKTNDVIRRSGQPAVATKIILSLRDEFNLAEYISIEEETNPVKELQRRSTHSTGGSRSIPMSWTADLSKTCLVCTLSLKSVVGGKDAGVVSYPCGHIYHVMCNPENSSCVACRVRMRSRISASQVRK